MILTILLLATFSVNYPTATDTLFCPDSATIAWGYSGFAQSTPITILLHHPKGIDTLYVGTISPTYRKVFLRQEVQGYAYLEFIILNESRKSENFLIIDPPERKK